MPWLSKAMKDVIGCEKLRGWAEYQLIRRYPNGATHPQGYPQGGEPAELKHLIRQRRRKQLVIP